MKSKIKSIKAREVLDSRGNWTVEVELQTEDGVSVSSVPSGASLGKYEAPTVEVGRAVKNISRIIGPKLKGLSPVKQEEIDKLIKKLRVGANATLGVSMAVCRAGAAAQNLPLYQYLNGIYGGETSAVYRGCIPVPCFNIINGGAHASDGLDFQEFMIVPRLKNFQKNLQAGTKIYHTLKEILKKNFGESAINLGDEGGFAPPIRLPEEALDLIQETVKKTGYQNKINIILDIAASQFYINGRYGTKFGIFTPKDLLKYYLDLIQKYPIIGLEDPFAEEDWEGWRKLKVKSEKLKVLIIGDDLLVTNPKRIKIAKEKNLCGAAIIKPNQIGTISEALEAARLAKSYGWKIMVSHRSGETNDDFISDLAVGIGADYIKAGAPARGERVVKYNRLLKIKQEIYG